MNIRTASEVEIQDIIYTLRSEHMKWEDIDPDKSRFFVTTNQADSVVGFIRYEPGILNALLSSIFVYPNDIGYDNETIAQQMVEHIEEIARSSYRQKLVSFSATDGSVLEDLGYAQVPVGEAILMVKETPQGRWLFSDESRLFREIAWVKNI
ncbi:MAG: hypothetical protein AAF902_18755 [Chloroflexota bacterium]